MSKYTIVALIGESGSGKDTIKQYLCNVHPELFHPIIMTTTRPKRDYEEADKDYHFISPKLFAKKIASFDIVEAQLFNGWAYGTDLNDLDKEKINIGAFSIASVEELMDNPAFNIFPIHIEVSDRTRLIRTLKREDNVDCEEVCRRFLSDKKDFAQMDFRPWIIPNEARVSTAGIMILNLLREEGLY